MAEDQHKLPSLQAKGHVHLTHAFVLPGSEAIEDGEWREIACDDQLRRRDSHWRFGGGLRIRLRI